MQITTRRVRSDDGPLLKRTRLAALADTPDAFASTLEAESQASDERWSSLARERASGRDHATFFAVDGEEVVGLVGGHRTGASTVELVSMWTDPDARGRGIGRALVDAVVAWADGSTVELWVTRGNERALGLYERCGFVTTGDHQPLPSDPCKDEVRMRRGAR